jgi:phosphoadenosine phosphosulfate reductase
MWQLIRKNGMPPRRMARYCCLALKENGGKDRFVLTGVRWGESVRRSKRRMTETCLRDKTRRYLHPIIDWNESDVWQYIRAEKIPYCKLYDEGRKRIGCVLCPMARDTQEQIVRWPKIARAWGKAVKATFKPENKKTTFRTPEEYWQWWLDRDRPGLNDEPNQCMMFED